MNVDEVSLDYAFWWRTTRRVQLSHIAKRGSVLSLCDKRAFYDGDQKATVLRLRACQACLRSYEKEHPL